MAKEASAKEASCTIAAELPVPRVSGMTFDRATLKPRSTNTWFRVARSGGGLGNPVMYKLLDGVTPSPAYFALHDELSMTCWVLTSPPAAPSDCRYSKDGKTSPLSAAMAEAASSCEASWTMAADMPVPRVSGMTLERTTVSLRPSKIRCSTCWLGGGLGSPVMYKLSEGRAPSCPAYFTLRVVPPCSGCAGAWLLTVSIGCKESMAGKTSPLSAIMAAAASSREASWTMAAELPMPRVSGMTLERTTVKPKSTKTLLSVA
mmetsp:Transcript_98992/g.275547  ORF Transcript_98992/g.275547 Transcript_98992/m.275547 type:complete len:261 (-) Transcript_98992:444-1226(-)